MKNYRDSDYAVNKYSNGIVYRFADATKEVTLELFLADNPAHTKEKFDALKVQSDEMYKETDLNDYNQTCKNVSFSALEETERCCAPSPEQMLFERIGRLERQKSDKSKLNEILDCLSKAQRRRYLLHKQYGLTTREIADLEGVAQMTVHDSLRWSNKKISKKITK